MEKLPDGDWTLDRQGEVLKIYEPLLLISFCSIPNFYQELENAIDKDFIWL